MLKKEFLFLLVNFLSFNGFAGQLCEDVFIDQSTALNQAAFKMLNQTKSYAIMDVKDLIDGQELYQSLPHDKSYHFTKGAVPDRNSKFNQVRALKYPQALNSINLLEGRIRKFIKESFNLTDDNIGLTYSDLRLSTTDHKGFQFLDWHVDKGGFSVTVALLGPGTEIIGTPDLPVAQIVDHARSLPADSKGIIVPTGKALIFWGSNPPEGFNYKPVIHRTPQYDGPRLLFTTRVQILRNR
jgi:hypothetical protein